MFSEYASRFLAQSQSRVGFPNNDERRTQPDTNRWQNRPGTTSRLHSQRNVNPYNPASSQISAFPFASRLNPQQAPLFYSATDEFREENDEEEHEREIADFYALQKSRRQLGGSDLKDSSEGASGSSLEGSTQQPEIHGGYGRPGGIRSSWRGGGMSTRGKAPKMADVQESSELDSSRTALSEVKLQDTLRTDADDEPPDDLMEDAPSVQHLRGAYIDSEASDDETDRHRLIRSQSSPIEDTTSMPTVPATSASPPRHDIFFGQIYLLALIGMFATWFVVFLHTTPNSNKRLGDTVYTTLHGSFHLLGVYTLVAIFVGLVWLAALRAYVRQLVLGILIVVPTILYSFALYPFVSSFKGRWDGNSVQDNVMRWSSLVPFLMATFWIIAVVRGRLAMQKAISIVEFATKILASNPALLMVGFATLGAIIGFTWIWLSMFTRVFLGGHLDSRYKITRFVIDASTWWLGLYFIIIYLWTIGMLFGLQRTITSATVSQWYFHRLAAPAPTSQTIVKAAVAHSLSILFGTVALFTGLSLLVRLPLLVLPRRMTMLIGVAMYSIIPSPIATLINPLSLTYAAIHSQSLAVSARGLSQLHFLSPTDATTSLHPNTFNRNNQDGWSADTSPLLPYRLAKLLLHATRFIMSLALGFGGWVSTARSMKLAAMNGVRGSLYAYIVGLIAGAIGWGILGAMEGVLACIVDAVVVCWGSEVGSSGRGQVRYCREAGYLFGEHQEEDVEV